MIVKAFSLSDYVVFVAMLLVSASIGMYHGVGPALVRAVFGGGRAAVRGAAGAAGAAAKGEPTKSGEFLTANGRLSALPVALSLLASFLSSITLMGQPAEVYLFGPQLWLFGVAIFAASPVVSNVFIPLFHRLKHTSAYEYFGHRFNRKVQILASLLFTIQMVLYMALVLYAPALALYQVTGLTTEYIVSVMYVVVIFYTTVGGMKAVIWTDCFQVVVLFMAMIAVLVKGTIDVGGLEVVWERNANAGRSTFFDWSVDPTKRYTVWSTLVGAGFLHMAVYGANQLQVQRYLSVPTVSEARKMLWINCIGWTIVCSLTVFAGMLIYAKYFDCDPLRISVVKKPDQLFPLFVMDTLGEYPGFPGLFVAGIFSAGLSTVSTGLNSLAAIWFAELEGTTFKASMSDNKATTTVKLLAFGFGLISFGLVFLVPYMGGLVPVAIALSGFFSGSVFGLFFLGLFVPWCTSLGAGVGLVAGVGGVAAIAVGAQLAAEAGQTLFEPLPTSTRNCAANATLLHRVPADEALGIFRVSFLWYSLLSIVITITSAMIVSRIFPAKPGVDTNYLKYVHTPCTDKDEDNEGENETITDSLKVKGTSPLLQTTTKV